MGAKWISPNAPLSSVFFDKFTSLLGKEAGSDRNLSQTVLLDDFFVFMVMVPLYLVDLFVVAKFLLRSKAAAKLWFFCDSSFTLSSRIFCSGRFLESIHFFLLFYLSPQSSFFDFFMFE